MKSKRTLYSKIKQILENSAEDAIVFPQVLTFCEGMGEPIFKISIEKNEEDHFIDEKGQKWVKAE
jgi:hypothetical protein